MREPSILSRRALAAVLPLAALVGAPPANRTAPTSAGADTTLLDLGRRWDAMLLEFETLNARFHAASDAEYALLSRDFDAEGKRLAQRESELFRAIFGTPATTAADLAIKARLLIREIEINRDIDLGSRDLHSVESAAADAEDTLGQATWGLLADVLRLAEKERTS